MCEWINMEIDHWSQGRKEESTIGGRFCAGRGRRCALLLTTFHLCPQYKDMYKEFPFHLLGGLCFARAAARAVAVVLLASAPRGLRGGSWYSFSPGRAPSAARSWSPGRLRAHQQYLRWVQNSTSEGSCCCRVSIHRIAWLSLPQVLSGPDIVIESDVGLDLIWARFPRCDGWDQVAGYLWLDPLSYYTCSLVESKDSGSFRNTWLAGFQELGENYEVLSWSSVGS